MSVVANVAINVDSRGAVGQLRAVQSQAQLTERAFGGLQQAIGALGVGFALSKVISDVKELDTNLRRLGTVGVDVEKISPALAKLSNELGGVASKAELAAASYQAASAGFSDTAGNINILRAATKAATGGLADTQAVTEVLVKTLNSYGMSGNQAIQVTDSISKAVELGNQEWSDYTSQLGRVASVAALAGVSLDEVNAFIASATKNGATAEIAFTGLSAVLTQLLQPTKESQEAAAKLGIQFNLAGLQSKGFSGLMTELAAAIDKDKEAAARMVGSTEGMRGAFAAASKDGKDFKSILEQIGGATGKTETDFQTMKGSLENTLKALDTSFKNLSEALGKAFGPTIVIAVQDITKAVSSFASIMNAIPQPVLNTTGQIIKLIAQMLLLQKAFQSIIAIRAAFIGAMVGMSGATAASGIAAKTSAGSIALYTNNTKTLAAQSAAATPLVAGLKNALQGLAAIGIITVGINLITTGLSEFIAAQGEINRLKGERQGGGVQLVGGATQTRENVIAKQKTAKQTIAQTTQQKKEAQKFDPVSFFLGGLAPLVGGKSQVQKTDAFRIANEKQLNAQAILGLSPSAFKPATPPKPQLPPPSGAIPPPVAGGGGGAEPKEKKIKAAKEILDISKQEATLRGQLALYTAQEDLYMQALLTKELAMFKAKQDQLGPNERKLQMFEAEITYVKTINDLEKEKTDKLKSQNELNQQRMQPLQDELALMQARLAGNEAEVMLKIQIRDIMAGTAGLAEKDVADTLNQIDATKRLLTEKEKIANLVQNIGASIEGGIVGAIDGAITGAKSLQESLTDILKDIGKMLISFGVKSLLGGIDIGGTKIFGGGKAAGGPVSSNSSYMVGEKGPELFVPSSAGTILPADTTAAMARYQRQGSSNDEPDPVAAMARYQRQAGNFGNMGGMGRNGSTTNIANNTISNGYNAAGNIATNGYNNTNGDTTNNGYNTAGGNTTNNGYNTAGSNTTNNGYDTVGGNTTNGYNTAGNNTTTNNGYDTASGDTVNNIQTSPSPVLSLSFETTRFLGQDYVSTDQLQAAMRATEKRAAKAAAKAAAAQITNKLQQSPAYRKQVGLR